MPTEQEQIGYVLNKVCVPTIADGVPFDSIRVSEHLSRHDRCDILYGCMVWFCRPDRSVCFQPPAGNSCWTTISGDSAFDRLTDQVRTVLNAGARQWRPVASVSTLPGYKKVLCPDDGSAEVDLAGFIEGQALGYVGPPLSEPHGPRTPVRAIGTEFDIHVRKQTPGQCPINPAG
jgi:hypothetical protein